MAAKTTVRVSLTNSAAKDDVFTGDAYSWLMEDGALTGSLNVLGNDPGSATLYAVFGSEPTGGQMAANASDTFSVDYFGTAYTGTLTKNANGTVGFDLSSMAGLMDSLAEDETFKIEFYYTAKMANGVLSTAKVSISIVGENDAPTISATSTLVGTVHEDGVLTAGGTVVGEDVDHGAVLGYTVDDTAGDYGTFALNAATGVWSYVLDNAAHQNLAEGETHVETFVVTVTDEHGASATQNVLVTVIGTNDAPEITSDAQTGALGEDAAAAVTGQVTSTDKDNGATATYTGNGAGTYGTFTVNSSTGEWAYTLTAAAQGLKAGQTVTETFTVTVTDDFGATATQYVDVTITGANDAPEVTSSVQTGALGEDDAAAATGQITSTDKDNGATATYTGSGAGTYGNFTVNSSTGEWAYTLTAAAQGLKAGQTVTETFTVTVTDDFGATATQNVDVTITGANDAPEVTSSVQTGALGEDDAAAATGQVTSTDKDNGATATYTGSGAGAYGNFTVNSSTGEWAYTLTAAAQGLHAGQTVTETFTVTVTDDFGAAATQNVDVTITGAADGAAIVNDPAGTQETAATEAGGVANGTAGDPSASGKLLVTDLDTGDAKFQVPASLAGAYGTFTFDADTGAWTYALDDAAANVQALTQGQAVTDSLVVTSLDGSASHTIQVNITGTNDLPTVTGADTGSVTEDMSFTATGTLVATDVDAGQSQFQAQTDIAGTYGKLSITSAGAWTYTLTNSAATVQALNSGQSVIDTITVLTADGTSKAIDITVNGQNELSGGLIDAVGAITSEMELFLNFRDANSDGVQDGFVNRVGLDPSANSNEVTWGDFNGDGKIDFVNASFADGNVYYFRNLGDANNDGVPEFAKSTIAVGPEGGWTLLANDIDGDGDLDLVVGGGYTGLDRVLVNTGDANNNGVPEFTGVALAGSTGYSYGMTAGDVNGDGINDIVSTNFGYGPLQVFYGRGDTNNDGLPEFSTAQTPPRLGGADISVAIADMDGDGDNDLVVTEWGGQRYIDYNVGDTNNDGNPDFVTKLLGSGGVASFDIKSVDLDGDGDLDLVSTNASGPLTLFLNQGDTNNDSFPDFTTQSIAINGTYSVDVGDWDHDGDADLIVSSNAGLHLIENLGVAGNGSILTATSFVATTQNGWSMDVAFVPDLLI